MANRVTATEVKVIIPTELEDAVVTTHIDIANDLVTSSLTSVGLSDTRLEHIELYLSAHLIALRDKLTGMTSAEWVASEAKVEFSSDFGRQLDATHYGQMAKMLDTSGTLNNLGKLQARFRAI